MKKNLENLLVAVIANVILAWLITVVISKAIRPSLEGDMWLLYIAITIFMAGFFSETLLAYLAKERKNFFDIFAKSLCMAIFVGWLFASEHAFSYSTVVHFLLVSAIVFMLTIVGTLFGRGFVMFVKYNIKSTK